MSRRLCCRQTCMTSPTGPNLVSLAWQSLEFAAADQSRLGCIRRLCSYRSSTRRRRRCRRPFPVCATATDCSDIGIIQNPNQRADCLGYWLSMPALHHIVLQHQQSFTHHICTCARDRRDVKHEYMTTTLFNYIKDTHWSYN